MNLLNLLAIHVLVPSDNWPAGRPDSRFARLQYTRYTRAQLACRRGVFTHASMQVTPLSLHAPAVDCPRNDDCAADRSAYIYLVLIDCQTNTYTRRASAHSLTLYTPAVARQRTKTIGHSNNVLTPILRHGIPGLLRLIPESGDSGFRQIRILKNPQDPDVAG